MTRIGSMLELAVISVGASPVCMPPDAKLTLSEQLALVSWNVQKLARVLQLAFPLLHPSVTYTKGFKVFLIFYFMEPEKLVMRT